ncbi:MAG TPA: hypothetical protein VNX28_05695 [Gemmataceae bacterium]|jgi:hypothetical protein|nr:hypothetical protein [Gemmataceae bacterium]
MPLVPHRFLFRLAHPCRHVKKMPRLDDDRLLDLPAECRIDNFAAMDEKVNFADVSLAWNELGLGLQVEVRGKDNLPQGDAARPRGSDGVTLWLDTRDARAGHRASRHCHQFHFLAAGGGSERDEPAFVQTKINRALEDAPMAPAGSVALKVAIKKHGYLLEAFLPATVLHGYDPEQHPRFGFYYSIRDDELGEQALSVGPEFPFWEDPSLWSVLELVP